MTVTARLNGGARLAETPITVSVGSGTAASGTDFTRISDFAITIAENSPAATGTFSLAPVDDNIDEPHETVRVTGSTTVAGLAVGVAHVVIEDNDAAPTVTLSLSDTSIGENGGTTTVTATLDRASGAATTVTISVTPVSPAVVADYSLSTNRTLTIAAGQTLSTRTVTLTAVNNDVDAADRTVTISGAAGNDVGVTDPADRNLTVEDDEERGVSLSKTELAVDEGDDGTYTVELDTQPTESVTVTPSRSSGDPDVTVSGALTFTTSNWSEPQTVTVSARQDADAADDRAVIGHDRERRRLCFGQRGFGHGHRG